MENKIIKAFIFLFFLLTISINAQESLKSIEEDYYFFLSLQGFEPYPTLNYRTLSDSTWSFKKQTEHIWQEQNLGTKHPLFNDFSIRIYGPELFASYNTASPYGQNDGALWQGKGLNSSLTSGARFEGYGIELTFKPQLSFSQNLDFDLIQREMSGFNYTDKAEKYGYFWGTIDAPQRFGDNPFFTFDWGDSEIRYTWKTITIGFGTQAIWLGPSYLNSILHSNNAPTYPKFDIGIRKQPMTIPWINWYIGDIEFRIWVGYLSESKYFDNDDSNDHNMFHGLSFAYAPSFLPGLTLFINRVCIVPWEWENLKFIVPKKNNTTEDQKMSFGAYYLLPQASIEVYSELGIDDFTVGGFEGYLRYPFHTMTYTIGLKKIINIVPKQKLYGEIIFEWNSMEMSQDFQFQWAYSPYSHGTIKQGYTNQGQWLGAGSGWGGNSQYLEFKLYYPKGTSSLLIQRTNPDNNFLYSKAIEASASQDNLERQYYTSWKSNFIIGINTRYFVTKQISIGGGFLYNLIINPYYYFNKTSEFEDKFMHNFSLQLIAKWNF
ncbi:conserved hypothetical protein [Leadbettera azotonutricia ZAS-9]|uniref:Capsule assembly protein Wzi n=2 Tax=Leadbettera azotonutricia TaxID=150829 RepID=F5YAW0_LEAAZ|nr:conserved hypothetical protein [Leadbettera azotonutricia ZAS-9]